MTVLEEYFPEIHSKEFEDREQELFNIYKDTLSGHGLRTTIRDMIGVEICNVKNKVNLDRFLRAQENTYSQALEEVKNGRKVSHWIWFIFPQMKGLGHSKMSEYYGIKNRGEAKAYMNHPILRQRLVEITKAVLNSPRSVFEIFGNDAIKVYSCVKLFASICEDPFCKITPNEPVFKQLMKKENWH